MGLFRPFFIFFGGNGQYLTVYNILYCNVLSEDSCPASGMTYRYALLLGLLLGTPSAFQASPAWSQRWNVTTPGAWFSGGCLFNASSFGYSAGDW